MLSGKYLLPLLHLKNNVLGEMVVQFFPLSFPPSLFPPPAVRARKNGGLICLMATWPASSRALPGWPLNGVCKRERESELARERETERESERARERERERERESVCVCVEG